MLGWRRWLWASVLALACASPEAEMPPNLLLVTIDTLRRDHCSVYGYERDTTPRLRAFAGKGVRFDAAYAPGPITGPTHATLFTGLFPVGHGVVKNGLVLDPDHETLAERLQARGYQTGAIVSSFAVDSRFGLSQGFERYRDRFDPARSSIVWKEWEGHQVSEGFDQPAPDATRRAIQWLDAREASRPFFLWVHYFDPHSPYIAPRRFRRFLPEGGPSPEAARAIALYDAEIAYTDFWLGKLLGALSERGLDADTLVAITSDHGEGLQDHGYMFHDFQLYEEAVRVPLLLRWPGRIVGGRVIGTPTSLVDLMPTLLDLLGVEAGPEMQGVSRARQLTGRAAGREPAPAIFLQRRPFRATKIAGFDVAGDGFAVRVGRWKYIETPEEGGRELYDLEVDPGESENVYAENAAVGDELSARIQVFRRSHARGEGAGRVSEEDRARLEALGYADDGG
jgi:arylsulfatase A-like enzyme